MRDRNNTIVHSQWYYVINDKKIISENKWWYIVKIQYNAGTMEKSIGWLIKSNSDNSICILNIFI